MVATPSPEVCPCNQPDCPDPHQITNPHLCACEDSKQYFVCEKCARAKFIPMSSPSASGDSKIELDEAIGPELVAMLREPLNRYAYSIFGKKAADEHFTCKAISKIWEELAEGNYNGQPILAWSFTTAKHGWIDWIRTTERPSIHRDRLVAHVVAGRRVLAPPEEPSERFHRTECEEYARSALAFCEVAYDWPPEILELIQAGAWDDPKETRRYLGIRTNDSDWVRRWGRFRKTYRSKLRPIYVLFSALHHNQTQIHDPIYSLADLQDAGLAEKHVAALQHLDVTTDPISPLTPTQKRAVTTGIKIVKRVTDAEAEIKEDPMS